MMNKFLVTCFILSSILLDLSLRAQEEDKKEKKGSITFKMGAARHEFLDNNYRGALLIYRDILKIEKEHSMAQYRSAECHYKLKRFDLALKYLEKAKANDPEVVKEMNFFYGQTYHRMARLDEAISSFNEFLSKGSPRSMEYELALKYLSQCQYAQKLMTEPVPVVVENIGREINSRFDDYAPSVTADGKTLIFTSRRSDTKGGEIDESSDYKFFEDIYVSQWDEKLGEWSDAESLPGNVNTKKYDAVLSVAPDGNQMFIYKNDDKLAGDIFMSQRNIKTGDWDVPERLDKPVNTSYYEGSVSITADGGTLYFISERTGGEGRGDIYTSQKDKKGEWDKPKNLGGIINTSDDEKFVFIHPNGKTLYFSSKGHQTMGGYDIFKSELLNGEWGTPVNLGYPINTVNEESTFSLTGDNSKLFVAAEYEDSNGERDIYVADVSNYSLISSDYDNGTFVSIVGDVTIDGSPAKKATVKYFNAKSDRFVGEAVTNKEGRCTINLTGNEEYRVEIKYKGFINMVMVDAKRIEGSQKVLKFDWKF